MQALLGLQGKAKIIVISLILFIVTFIIGLIGLITGSYILGVIVLLALIWYLLTQVGGIVMYPGSFFFTRSDIELRFSRETGSRIIDSFKAIQTLATFVVRRKYEPYRNYVDFVAIIDRYMSYTIAMLQMFEGTLSERKTIMLRNFRQLKSILEQKEGENLSLMELIYRPNEINNIQQSQLPFYKSKITVLGQIVKDITQILKTYAPPQGTLQLMKFRMQAQNLYEIRFGFASWERLFEYQINMIPTTDGQHIESTIIHKIKSRTGEEQKSQTTNKKTVLFCNPNGVFIQFFGADNSYIRNYLRLGYKVILWNYRGYGQSTGNPSIRISQIDATNVYRYYRSLGYEVEIVHGYSIGGAAAVGLVEEAEKSENGVKILIVDRSFSSIGQMSVQFGDALHRLTKIIFYKENIDLSKQYQVVRCRKLLIWDFSDEVIPDKASVKNKILKRRRSSLVQSNYTFDQESERDQLNQDVTALRPQISSGAAFEEIAKKLQGVVIEILTKSRKSHSDKELNVMDEREISGTGTTSAGLDTDNLDLLVRSINKVDGGGIVIFHNPHQLEHILHERPDYFYHVMQSYILGLVCYGSYLPLHPIVHNHEKIKAETLRKIDRLLKEISSQKQVNSQNYPGQKNNIHSAVHQIYQKITSLIEEFYCEQWFAVHGSLLPTNNGHNNSLTETQYRVLNSYLTQGMQQMQQQTRFEDSY